MADHYKRVELMECDFYRRFPTKLLLEYCMGYIMEDITPIGGGTENLYRQCGAVWMLSHMRVFQEADIFPNDLLCFRVYRRVVEGARYVFLIDILREEELVAKLDCSFIPVYKEQRRVVRLDQVEPIWTEPPRTAESKHLQRMRPKCAFFPCGEDAVRYSDCDWNGHMTSGAYVALACNMLGFWGAEEPRRMRKMQIDYASEVRPGTLLQFERGTEDGVRYLRGIKPDGTIAFTAACDF